MTEFPIQEVVAIIVTLISLIYAWWKKQQLTSTVSWYTVPTTAATVNAQTNAVAVTVPVRSWTMADSTKKWITFGETDEDKASILGQVCEAESAGLTSYTIHYSKGYYAIEYGLIKASGREK